MPDNNPNQHPVVGLKELNEEVSQLRKDLNSNVLVTELSKKDIEEAKKFQNEVGELVRGLSDSLSRIDKVVEIQEINANNAEERFNRRSDEIKNLICELRRTTNDSIEQIKEFQTKSDEELKLKFAELQEERITPIEDRLTVLERFKWLMLGGIILGAYLIDKVVSFVVSFFKLF